jgi:hypothetical protein
LRREGRVASEPALAEVSWPRQRFEYLIRVKASQLPDDNDAMLNYGLVEGEVRRWEEWGERRNCMQRGRVGVSRWFCLGACRYYSVPCSASTPYFLPQYLKAELVQGQTANTNY